MATGRIPEQPWYRKSTRTYYTTLGGVQIPLGRDKREAHAEFNRIMVARGKGNPGDRRITVGDLMDLWLFDCNRKKKSITVVNYEIYAESFRKVCGDIRVCDLRPYHVDTWVGEQRTRKGKPWAPSTVHLAISVVKAMTSWGKSLGYIDADPIEKMERPGMERRRPITMGEACAVMAESRPAIEAALRVLLVTGIRPGELCSMTAERTDLESGKATVKGKATRRNKTGIRSVMLSAVAVDVLRPIVEAAGKGPLFINSQGKPITVKSLEQCVVRARKRACKRLQVDPGAMEHVTPHCFRGLFATEGMRNGVPAELLSKLLGQSSASVLMKHYASPDDPMLRKAVEQATAFHTSGRTPDKTRDPRD